MVHNRKLVLSAVSLVEARVRNDGRVATEIRDELEPLLIGAGWFPDAPFKWVGLIIRYGLATEEEPHYRRIDKRDGELPLAIEVDTHRILELDEQPKKLKAFFKPVVVRCLLSVARRYHLPSQELVKELEATNAP
jgi:hypothetical protein